MNNLVDSRNLIESRAPRIQTPQEWAVGATGSFYALQLFLLQVQRVIRDPWQNVT